MKNRKPRQPVNRIQFAFKDVPVDCECSDQSKELVIQSVVQQMSKNILIDSTYVESPRSKYTKTFIDEDGWNQLLDVLESSGFGKTLDNIDTEELFESYRAMIIEYLYIALEDIGFDVSKIYLEIDKSADFTVEILQDNHHDIYVGRWQTWK